jgi:hypothetical protein
VQAGEVKLGKVFANDHQSVIPLFQRPYVWAEPNWLPLWRDVRKAAEEVEAQGAEGEADDGPDETYFLGAIVVQQRRRPPRRLASSHIIDGQQRLTTLQVLLAAARAAAQDVGAGGAAARFTSLLENRTETIHPDYPDDLYKVWPLPQDRDAFFWSVRPPSETEHPAPDDDHVLVQARRWFEQAITEWAVASDDAAQRMEDLHFALEDRMQLVEISLDSGDDPQVIFEALNHRGVKLAAADLVKNLLFQTVESQGDHAVAERLLTDGWLPLDGRQWRRDVTTGRITRALVDLLLAYWLTIQTEQDVVVEHLFADTKKWLRASGARAADVIGDIRHHADTYESLLLLPAQDPSARLLDDMQATGTTTPWPVLLYLHANPAVPAEQRAVGVAAIESFLMRRGMCALTTKDYNRLFVIVLAAARQAPAEWAGDTVRDVLAAQTADSRRWPTDSEFIDALLQSDVYHPPYRARLKAFLVGLENHLRTNRTEPLPVLSRGDARMNVEHVLPQAWESNWPLPADTTGDPLARRENAVHRLGNLTLTTVKLNSSLSNNPWATKRADLQRHSLLLLTTASVLAPPEGVAGWDEHRWSSDWDEDRIQLRGFYLAHHALNAWPRPELADS